MSRQSHKPIYSLTVYKDGEFSKTYPHHTTKSARHHAKTLACSRDVYRICLFDGTQNVEIYSRQD